jgi:predicted ATPase
MRLDNWFKKALQGQRQLVFVTGEPGIGKTTLIDAFVFRVQNPQSHEESQRSKRKRQK